MPLFTLLLKYNANIIQDSEKSTPILWNALDRALRNSPNVDSITIIEGIAEKLGTTLEAIKGAVHKQTDKDFFKKISLPSFVEQEITQDAHRSSLRY